jgi:NDP-sugar pyrophosphorylase family protein
MILAAGFGTRLRPITYSLPKPMVPLCNQPLIGWAAESLVRAGVRDIIVNLHHLPGAIEEYLPTAFPNARFEFSREEEILGTGGGIRRVRPLLQNESAFFLVNGDTVQFPRFEELRAAREQVDALAALTLRHPPEGDKFTAVFFEDGLINGFGEGHGEALMFAGSHLISSRVFDYLPETAFSSIVDDVYRPVIGREPLAGVVDDGVWFDIGTPRRYMSASASLLQLIADGKLEPPKGSRVQRDNLVHESSRASATRSVIGSNSLVEGDVSSSVIWSDCRIGPGVSLAACIVADGVELSGGSYANAMICRDDEAIPRDAPYRFEDGLVFAVIPSAAEREESSA